LAPIIRKEHKMAMNSQDRQAIEQLFARLEEVERQSTPRDPEAERFIQQRMARQPGSAYYMAQSIIALEQGLANANQRLEEFERQGSRGSLMPKRFDSYEGEDEMVQQRGRGSVPSVGPAGAYRQQPAEGAGGGFLAGAFQTALGVSGGLLLGNAIGSIFGSGKAQAAESRREEPQKDDNQDEDNDDADENDDEGGGGGFLDSIFGGGDDEG
jgi:uncharacterized protein